jgi:molecular chaperone GrpE (heat shock protein)
MALFRRGSDRPSDSDASEEAVMNTSSAAVGQAAVNAAAAGLAPSGATESDIEELREVVMEIQRVVLEVADRGNAQEKVFDVLHQELQEYKNDFIYEHLKPVLWPLLFLFDSLEQYAREVVQRVSFTGDQQLEAKEVLEHLKFFRGQLVEALRICEVTPMKQPSGVIDPKCHKGIGVEKVDDPADENTVRRVVRTGWYLNGKVLRHAEVIIGKVSEPGAPPTVTTTSAPSAATTAAVRNGGTGSATGSGTGGAGNLAKAADTLRSSSDASASGGGRGG